MQLLTGVNHVAVLTEDLDRFIDFYQTVFEIEVVFAETTPTFRHAILRTGPDSWLHPAEVAGNPHRAGVPAMFDRGHIDHLALTAASARPSIDSPASRRAGAPADGAVDDLGPFHSLWFADPDGMLVELAVIVAARPCRHPRAAAACHDRGMTGAASRPAGGPAQSG